VIRRSEVIRDKSESTETDLGDPLASTEFFLLPVGVGGMALPNRFLIISSTSGDSGSSPNDSAMCFLTAGDFNMADIRRDEYDDEAGGRLPFGIRSADVEAALVNFECDKSFR
jgi:hypothetical protein